MTTDQFIIKVDKQLQDVLKFDKPLALAVKSVMALQSERIFLNAKNTDGGIIGEYKKKGIYVPLLDSPKKFTPKGKPNADGKAPKDTNLTVIRFGTKSKKKIKASGLERKTGYFESWLNYKTAIGMNQRNKTVDLMWRGELHRNWANSKILGEANAIKKGIHNYIVALSENNIKKISSKGTDGLRYGRVFNLSKHEKESFMKVINYELKKALE